jgi:hypothetical protein
MFIGRDQGGGNAFPGPCLYRPTIEVEEKYVSGRSGVKSALGTWRHVRSS